MRDQSRHLLVQQALRLLEQLGCFGAGRGRTALMELTSRRERRGEEHRLRQCRPRQPLLHSPALLPLLLLQPLLRFPLSSEVGIRRILFQRLLGRHLLVLQLRHGDLDLVQGSRKALELGPDLELLLLLPQLGRHLLLVLHASLIQRQAVAQGGARHAAGCARGARRPRRETTRRHTAPWCGSWRGAGRGARRHAPSHLLGIDVGGDGARLGRGQGPRPVRLVHRWVLLAVERCLHGISGDGVLRLHEHGVGLLGRAEGRGPGRLPVALHEARSGAVSALCGERRCIGPELHDLLQLLVGQLWRREDQSRAPAELLGVVQLVDHLDGLWQVVLLQSLQLPLVILPPPILLVHTVAVLHSLQGDVCQAQRDFGRLLWPCGVEAHGWRCLEGNLLRVVNTSPVSELFGRRNTCGLQLAALLEGRQSSGLFELLLPRLPLGLLAARVGQPRTCL
mmetsp:Transcript_41558/g.124176  ORF Transcript_41558/g.124176 Transcript_41558/m.124176 type:complete len:451 (-) Transcript_41558:472-1824(-)